MDTDADLAYEDELRRAYMAKLNGGQSTAAIPVQEGQPMVLAPDQYGASPNASPAAPQQMMTPVGPSQPPAAPAPVMETQEQMQWRLQQERDAAKAGQSEAFQQALYQASLPPLEGGGAPAPQRPRMGGGGGGGPAPSPWMLAVAPQANQAHQQSLALAKQAIGDRQALGARAAQEDTGALMAGEAVLEEAGKRFSEMKNAQAAQSKLVEERLANAVEALDGQEIDNDRWWNKKSTGQKIAFGLGAVLAGLGSGLRREAGTNAGLNLINQEMQMDVMAQKDQMDRSGKKVAGLQNLYGQMMRRFGDEDQAFSAAMAIGTNKAASKLRTLAAARGDEESKIRAEEMLAKLAEQEQQWLMAVYKPRPMGGGGKSFNDKLAEKILEKRKLGEVDLELHEGKIRIDSKYAKGKGDSADAEKLGGLLAQQKIGELAGDLNDVRDKLDRVKDRNVAMSKPARLMYENTPSIYRATFGNDAYEAQQAVSGLDIKITDKYKGNAVSKADADSMKNLIQTGDFQGVNSLLKSMERSGASQLDTVLSPYTEDVKARVLENTPELQRWKKPKSAQVNND